MKNPSKSAALFLSMLFLTLAVSIAGCGLSQDEVDATATQAALFSSGTQTARAPTATPLPTRTPTTTPTPTLPAPEEILESAMEAIEAAGSYHFEMDMMLTASGDGFNMEIPMKMIGDSVSPDRTHSVITMSIFGSSIEVEQVRIGERIYQKGLISDEWTPQAETGALFESSSFLNEDQSDLRDLTLLGIEMVDGMRMYHLRGKISTESLGEAGGDMTAEYWVGVDDDLLHKQALDGEFALEEDSFFEEMALTGSISMTMDLSDFGVPVEIEEPVLPGASQPGSPDNPANWVRSLAWSPDGERIAVGSADSSVSLWDAETGEGIWAAHEHPFFVRSLSWSPDNGYLASGDDGGSIMVRDPETGEPLKVLAEGIDAFGYLAFSPDGDYLAFAGQANVLSIWDTSNWKETQTIGGKQNEACTGIVWSPEGERLAASSTDGTVTLWEVETGDPLHTLSGQKGWVNALAWSPTSNLLASGGDGGKAVVWDSETGGALTEFEGHSAAIYAIEWSPDGKLVASSGIDRQVILWDPQTGQVTQTFDAGESVLAVAWSPDGSRLAAGTALNTVLIWDIETGAHLELDLAPAI